jgi:hypothetical protein
VAKAIRPLMEGYYYRRFPDAIPRGMTLGNIIARVVDPVTTGPLVNLRPLVPRLNELNKYAREFQHDTNEASETAPVIDSELLPWATESLNLIHVNG